MKRLSRLAVITALTLTALTGVARANPSSGLLLGVYAFPNWQGLRIVDTIPGYSAQGRLFRNDVITRVTLDGVHLYPTRSMWQFEQAKDAIGPFRPAALEVYRPGHGYQYFWVEFRPVGVSARAFSATGKPITAAARNAKMKARVLTEKERPGARALFQRTSQRRPLGSFTKPSAIRPGTSPGSDPRNLFRRR